MTIRRSAYYLVLALALITTGVMLILSSPAHATGAAGPSWTSCPNLSAWATPNPDETTRRPTPTADGLEFSDTDLVHHAADLDVADLGHGTYVASPAPDQSSFFSVEVYGTDGGYATLRWNPGSGKWEMSTGGQFYENADPAALVDMPTAHKSHHVISFGVGYTEHPAGTVTTVVSSVTFGEHTYDLTCVQPSKGLPPHSSAPTPVKTLPGHSASASPSHSASPTTPPTTSPAAGVIGGGADGGTGALAITGPSLPKLIGVGLGIVLLGLSGVLVAQRRRKTTFQA